MINQPVVLEMIDQFVKKGKIGSSFEFMMDAIKNSELEKNAKSLLIDDFNRLIGISIKKNVKHCGDPVEVVASYNFETELHALEITCNTCWKYKKITLPIRSGESSETV
jgi:hypothetical protein